MVTALGPSTEPLGSLEGASESSERSVDHALDAGVVCADLEHTLFLPAEGGSGVAFSSISKVDCTKTAQNGSIVAASRKNPSSTGRWLSTLSLFSFSMNNVSRRVSAT